MDSRWEGVSGTEHIARRYALCCKYRCPSLQFIRVQDWSWQFVYRQDNGNAQGKEKQDIQGDDNGNHFDFAMIALINLEWEEVLEIDIFAYDWGEHHSGLPRRDGYGPPNPLLCF